MILLHSNSERCELTPGFTTDEVVLLRNYITESERLAGTAVLQREPRYLAFCLTEDGPQAVSKPALSDDDVGALLHRLRPFVLEKDPYYFCRIRKLAHRRIDNRVVRAVLDKELEEYDSRAWQKELRIKSGERILNSEEMLKLWLYASEYHRNPDKQEPLQQVLATSIPGLQYWTAIKLLIRKARAVLRMATLLRVVIGLQESVDFAIDGVTYTLQNDQVTQTR